MGCSVIVCTDGRRKKLLIKCVDSISKQRYEDIEIVCVSMVDDLPEDVTSRCKVIVEKRKGVSLAKNVGIQKSRFDIIALTDDDCYCDTDWVGSLVSEFEDENVGCVTGGSFPTREGLWSAATRWEPDRKVFTKKDGFVLPWLMGAGNNVSFRKKAIVDIGLFDEGLGPGTNFRSAEDIDVFHRIVERGYSLVYTPKAVVHHEPLDTYDQVRTMMLGYRIGIGAFFAKYRSSGEMRRYFLGNFLKTQLRDSRNNLFRGDLKMGYLYLIGFLGALKGFFGYMLAH